MSGFGADLRRDQLGRHQSTIIHFALPSADYAHSAEEDFPVKNSGLRFRDFAVQALIAQVCESAETRPSRLSAKIVGGASVIDELKRSAKVGELNIEIARRLLRPGTRRQLSIFMSKIRCRKFDKREVDFTGNSSGTRCLFCKD